MGLAEFFGAGHFRRSWVPTLSILFVLSCASKPDGIAMYVGATRPADQVAVVRLNGMSLTTARDGTGKELMPAETDREADRDVLVFPPGSYGVVLLKEASRCSPTVVHWYFDLVLLAGHRYELHTAVLSNAKIDESLVDSEGRMICAILDPQYTTALVIDSGSRKPISTAKLAEYDARRRQWVRGGTAQTLP